MSELNQYQDDKKRLAVLLEKHTGIKAKNTIDHIDKYGAGALRSGAINICTTEAQRQKLTLLFEFKNIYETVKSADNKKEYILDSPDASMEYFKNYFTDIADKEHVVAAFTNSNHKVITTVHISAGTINSALVDSRDIVKEALFCNAVGVVVAHNHPSGLLIASEQDVEMTKTLQNALSPVRVELNDHIIVGGDKAISLAERGKLPSPQQAYLSNVALSDNQKSYSSKTKQPSVKQQISTMKSERLIKQKTHTGIESNRVSR